MTFVEATAGLTAALRQETMLARTGALGQLGQAATAKQEAFALFQEACAARELRNPGSEEEQEALRALLTAANESALVLEAVRGVLDDFVTRLKAAVSSLADSGTYKRNGQRLRHAQAVRLDSRA
jgi:hypothetical protein